MVVGYLEMAFGTLPEPIRVRASFGLVAGVTPAVDKYTKLARALGERFLMVRQTPDMLKSATKAAFNTGQEEEMRAQLRQSVTSFIGSLNFSQVPTIDSAMENRIVRMGCYCSMMRSRVWARYHSGQLTDMDPVYPEIPTRISKQLKKLSQLLALIRGRSFVTQFELTTIARVARNSCNPRRQRIMDVYEKVGLDLKLNVHDITGHAKGLYYQTVSNETKIMEVLNILETNDGANYRLTDDFKSYVEALYPTPPSVEKTSPETPPFLNSQGVGV